MGGSTCMPHFWAMKSMEGTNVLSQYHSFSNGRPTESGRHPYVQRMFFFRCFITWIIVLLGWWLNHHQNSDVISKMCIFFSSCHVIQFDISQIDIVHVVLCLRNGSKI